MENYELKAASPGRRCQPLISRVQGADTMGKGCERRPIAHRIPGVGSKVVGYANRPKSGRRAHDSGANGDQREQSLYGDVGRQGTGEIGFDESQIHAVLRRRVAGVQQRQQTTEHQETIERRRGHLFRYDIRSDMAS